MVAERLHAVADGVARRLVAGDDQQDEERRQVLARQRAAFELGIQQHRGQVLARPLAAILGHLLHERRELGARAQRRADQILIVRRHVRVAETEDAVGVLEDLLHLALGDPHQVDDHLERKRRRELRHEIAFALLDHAIDHRVGPPADALLEARKGTRRETAGDDPALRAVARIVHVDHAAEELVELARERRDRGRPGGRAEELGLAARFENVGVARERPVSRPDRKRQAGKRALDHPGHRPLSAQCREGTLAFGGGPQPERLEREIDLVDTQDLCDFHFGRTSVGARQNFACVAPSVLWGRVAQTRTRVRLRSPGNGPG